MCGSMVDIQSPTTEIRRGKKEEERYKPQSKNIMACPLLWAAIKSFREWAELAVYVIVA